MPAALAARTVRSADGTTINYRTTGTGPGVVVVPGALTEAADYAALAGALGAGFAVHTVERRGRGGSGPQGDGYGMAAECADLAAVLAATGARYVFGHSYGGLVALETARREPGIAKLALYEPGVSVQGLIAMDWIPRYREFLARGRPFDAFATFVIGTGPAAVRRNPRWLLSAILHLAIRGERRRKIFQLLDANLREHEEVGRLDGSYPHYREVSADVLLMAGGSSKLPWLAPAFDRLTEVLPAARTHTFPGLDHFGPDQKGPAQVAEVVAAFFRG